VDHLNHLSRALNKYETSAIGHCVSAAKFILFYFPF